MKADEVVGRCRIHWKIEKHAYV